MKTIQIQLTITLDEAAANTLAQLLAPAIKQAIGVTLSESDQKKDALLRASQNAKFGAEKLPEDQGLLIDYTEAAKLLKVSQKTVNRMHTTGKMPPPIRIRSALRWSLEVLKKWVEAGCPIDPKWRTTKQ